LTAGRLVLVGTPIGNLGDLPPRAVEALSQAALICCEDTRRTGRLLQHAGIVGARMAVANEHTEVARVSQVLGVLAAGDDVAVVTDAGTPGISDPGSRLVRAALDAGHEVTAVPGPAALVMALVVSGFETTRFVFEGFLPRSGAERTRRLAVLAGETRTAVLYEAPHRIARTVDDLLGVCGPDRPVALARELTKLHEEVRRGTPAELATWAVEAAPRGEVVVLVGPPLPQAVTDEAIAAKLTPMLSVMSLSDAAKTAADDLGVAKARVYDIGIALKRRSEG
jgi:16S rRNA (cytidine1402-2'-O)-methyltransferase